MGLKDILHDRALLKANLLVSAFGLTKIPMLFFIGPIVEELSSTRVVMRIRFRKRVKNHVGSMYFGVLMAGADLAGGLAAIQYVREKKLKVSLVFKDAKGEFLKRAEGDTVFVCNQVQAIRDLIDQAVLDGQRHNLGVEVLAYVPSKEGDEPVAKFLLTASVKNKG